MHQEGTHRSVGPFCSGSNNFNNLLFAQCYILCKILTHDCVTMGTRGVAVYLLYFVLPSYKMVHTASKWSHGQTWTTPPDTIINGVFVLSASYPPPVWRLWIFLSWLWKENLEIVTIKRIIAQLGFPQTSRGRIYPTLAQAAVFTISQIDCHLKDHTFHKLALTFKYVLIHTSLQSHYATASYDV